MRWTVGIRFSKLLQTTTMNMPDKDNREKSDSSQEIASRTDAPLAKNANPRANENIRERTAEADAAENETGAGSEITDGEDA
jgi:hypothetical protein